MRFKLRVVVRIFQSNANVIRPEWYPITGEYSSLQVVTAMREVWLALLVRADAADDNKPS